MQASANQSEGKTICMPTLCRAGLQPALMHVNEKPTQIVRVFHWGGHPSALFDLSHQQRSEVVDVGVCRAGNDQVSECLEKAVRVMSREIVVHI